MTLQEFTDRMNGNTVDPEVFAKIHDLYIQAGDLDKDTFCDDWKLHGTSKILTAIWEHYNLQRDALEVYKEEHKEAAELLIKLSWDYGIKEASEMAETMLTKRGVIRYKLEHGIDLSADEKDYILRKI